MNESATVGKLAVESMLNGVQKYHEWYKNTHHICQNTFDFGKKIMTGTAIDSDEFFETCKSVCKEFTQNLTNGFQGECPDLSGMTDHLESCLSDQNPVTDLYKNMLKYHLEMYNLSCSLLKQSKQSLAESFCHAFAGFMNASKECMAFPKMSFYHENKTGTPDEKKPEKTGC